MITQRAAIEVAVALFKVSSDEREGPAWYQHQQDCMAVLRALREDNPKIDARNFLIYCGFEDNFAKKCEHCETDYEHATHEKVTAAQRPGVTND
jgi:hypothetical protein